MHSYDYMISYTILDTLHYQMEASPLYWSTHIHYQMEASTQLDMVVEPSTHSHITLT